MPALGPLSAWRSVSNSCWRPTKRVSPRATAACRRVRTGPHRQLKGVYRLRQSLTRTGPSGSTWTWPSASRRTSAVIKIDPGMAICSMRAQVDGLADSGIVHVQVTANGAHHFPGIQADAHLDGDTSVRCTATAYCCTNSCIRRAA